MSPVSPFLVLPALVIVLLITALFLKFSKEKLFDVRYKAIDGLRGYLAFFVLLHHSSIWYFYLHTGVWGEPPSHLFIHFGQTSVSVFFMITGFLFFQKLINGKQKPVDWMRLFVSRILRLYPVYSIAMFFGFIIILYLTQWTINERGINFLHEIFQWGTFTIVGKPPINGTMYLNFITAGVTWTLIYEWLFYLSLPLIGLIFFRSRVNVFILLVSIALVLVIYQCNLLKPINFYSFAAGLVAAILVKWEKFRALITAKIFSIIAILCLMATIYFFESPYEVLPLTLIAAAFIIIACGNNFFGLLSHPVSRMLGQISYPVYLLHPIALFVMFKFIVGFDNASRLSLYAYWLIISICASAIIFVSFGVHYFIELPCMNSNGKVTVRIRKLLDAMFNKKLHY